MAESVPDKNTIKVTEDREFFLALAHVNFDGKENYLFSNSLSSNEEYHQISTTHLPIVIGRIIDYKPYWHPSFDDTEERHNALAMLKLMAPSLGNALMRNAIYLATYFAATMTKESIAPLLRYETEEDEDKGALSVLLSDYPKLDKVADGVKKIPEGGVSLVAVAPWLMDFYLCTFDVSMENIFVNADVLSALTDDDHKWLAFKEERGDCFERLNAAFKNTENTDKDALVRGMLKKLVEIVQGRKKSE
ncbi:MAG: hypothetical protein ABW189_01185 [Rickettsiales bacterium]